MRNCCLLMFALGAAIASPVFAHHAFFRRVRWKQNHRCERRSQQRWSGPTLIFTFTWMPRRPAAKCKSTAFSSGPPGMLHKAGIRKTDFRGTRKTVTITAAFTKDGTRLLGWMKMIKYSGWTRFRVPEWSRVNPWRTAFCPPLGRDSDFHGFTCGLWPSVSPSLYGKCLHVLGVRSMVKPLPGCRQIFPI